MKHPGKDLYGSIPSPSYWENMGGDIIEVTNIFSIESDLMSTVFQLRANAINLRNGIPRELGLDSFSHLRPVSENESREIAFHRGYACSPSEPIPELTSEQLEKAAEFLDAQQRRSTLKFPEQPRVYSSCAHH
jgi:hypothetical protein